MINKEIIINGIPESINAEKFHCYYHPSKTNVSLLKCRICKHYYCEDDALYQDVEPKGIEMCPVCVLRFERNRHVPSLIIISIAKVIFLLFDLILLPIGAYEFYINSEFSNLILVIVLLIVFWFTTVLLIGSPFIERKTMKKIEFNGLLFLRSIEKIEDKKILSLKHKLERKHKKHLLDPNNCF